MKRGIAILVLWLLISAFLSGVFILPSPPGGVMLPYYLFVLFMPVGALNYARYSGRASVAFCYGLIAGAWFGSGIFLNKREIIAGSTTIEEIEMKIGLFVVAMSLTCCFAFVSGRRLFRKADSM